MQLFHCNLRRADRRRETRLGSDLPQPPASSPQPRRPGLTLIELLITITIIAILAGMILGAASIAGESAREAHTRHMIARMHTLLVQHLNTYKTRRVKLRPQIVAAINNQNISTAQKGQLLATARLYATREMLMMEIPDRWSDIAFFESEQSSAPTIRYPYYLDFTGANFGRTELGSAYLRRYIKAAQLAPNLEALRDNQGAECLYLVITLACGDGEARTLFHESSIGDTDGDGAPEFIDGWGHPINFLRWAPGFDSEIQLNANDKTRMGPGNPPVPANSDWKAAALGDHDPFDVFRVDAGAFRLVPLVFSAGRDETFGIRLVKPYAVLQGLTQPQLTTVPSISSSPTTWPAILPYALVTDPDDGNIKEYLGTVSSEGTATDNIHNHLLGEK